jgi:hypothetical protein
VTDEQTAWVAEAMVRYNGLCFGWRGSHGIQLLILPGWLWRRESLRWTH